MKEALLVLGSTQAGVDSWFDGVVSEPPLILYYYASLRHDFKDVIVEI
jgi:hypothetical protein